MEHRAFGQQALELRNAEERILSGVLVPYDSPTRIGHYVESFQRGAFTGTDPSTVPLLRSHEASQLPIGVTQALVDEDAALTGEWRVAETQAGDEVLSLASSGVPLSLSVGFRPVQDKWSSDHSRVTRVKANLGEVSVVALGAYSQAKVTSVRADDGEGRPSSPRLTIARRIRP